MNKIILLDKALFKIVNGQWHNDFFDKLMPMVRTPSVWIPLYLFLFVLVLVNFKKDNWWWLIFAACTITVCNFVSSDIIKESFFRLRPCNDPQLADSIHFLLGYKPQSSSFTSSHAVNHFGMAAFFYYTLRKKLGLWSLLFFFWAAAISYAQVYVGVHFPIDVICGAVIGFVLGYLCARSYNKTYDLQ